jgi:hypothetical protein
MDQTLMDIYKADGVADLPMKVRIPFAKALMAERLGNTEEAETWLNTAVEAEVAIANESKK